MSDFGIEEDKRLRKLVGQTVRSVDVQAGKRIDPSKLSPPESQQ